VSEQFQTAANLRPVIFDYQAIHTFVKDMLNWRRINEPGFQVKSHLKRWRGCSPTLVYQISNGNRRLTRDKVGLFSNLLSLTRDETKYLDRWIAADRAPANLQERLSLVRPPELPPRNPKNHLLTSWLNLYVKEACRLRGFRPEPHLVQRLLNGLGTLKQIEKSLRFLIAEGFIKRTLQGKWVQNEFVTTTTRGIPDKKIREFHKHALDIAKQGLDRYPVSVRESSAFVFAISPDKYEELEELACDFMDQVQRLAQSNPDGNEKLYQVLVNLTPVGGGVDETH